jgi:[ribosomal protein S18]-alanine N-acetyltransferase
MNPRGVEIRAVGGENEAALGRFFTVLHEGGVDKFFHPHPFTAEAARERAAYSGKDLYYVVIEGDEILGYGMLRGWDEGYEVPSLGIVIHPLQQGLGLGRLLMDFLRLAAWRRGAKKIRLRVYPENTAAVNLYRKLGYELTPEKDGPCLAGFLNLERG